MSPMPDSAPRCSSPEPTIVFFGQVSLQPLEDPPRNPDHSPALPDLHGLPLGIPAGVRGEGEDLPVDPRHFLLYLVLMSSQQAKYRPPPPSGALELAPDCLMFAIDDTGHERLRGQSIYGLGGCAV